MASVSPLIRSFNGGEVSRLVEGRTDLDRYPSSNRKLLNTVAAPQGPAIPRSGTEFVQTAYKPDKKSALVPFVFSEEQAYMLEFADGRVRFLNDDGILVQTPQTATGTGTSPFTFTSAGLTTFGAAVGDQVVLGGYAANYNLNGVVANITAVSGDDYTIDATYPALSLDTNLTVALVYSIASPYAEADTAKIRDLQSLDVVYIFHPTKPPQKLGRRDTYDWFFEQADFTDGPYMPVNETSTKFTPSITGNAIPVMSGASSPAGSTASASSEVVGFEAWRAFDQHNNTSYWSSNVNQTGTLQYRTTTPFVCDGYTLFMAFRNSDTTYTSKDQAPSNWTFEASNDGSTWVVLDRQNNYVLYDDNKTVFFPLDNTTSYEYYRIVVESCVRNGTIKPIIGRMVLRSTSSVSMQITASSTTGVNSGKGFLTTDIGRLIRIRGTDNQWRSLKITARSSTTVVTATLLGEPFSTTDGVTEWRLGYWSDTTGYPNCGAFYQDRLWFGGSTAYPDLVVASMSGQYENLSPSDAGGEVLDTHSIVVRLNSRRLSKLRWMAEGDKGLACSTGSREWLISAADGAGKAITPANALAKTSSARGSADIEAIPVDNQILFVPRSGRALREHAYVYEADGYKSPSMSLLSSHLGQSPFVQIAYAAEPYSIAWIRRQNGTLVGLTYNRDENVIGWHRHDFSGGIVENIAVIPSADNLQDTLWLVIRREVNGQQVRYIEKLTRFWDFGMTIAEAHYVDCALRYVGTAISTVYGFAHLEGREDIYGLADGIPVGPFTVENGAITLQNAAENIIIGIGFDSEGETSALENGAQDGTSMGKPRRYNAMSVNVWDSYGGEIGTWNENEQREVYTEIEYPARLDVVETISLYNGNIGPIIMQPGYEKKGSVFFRRRKEVPLPFNLISIMPKLTTQDGG